MKREIEVMVCPPLVTTGDGAPKHPGGGHAGVRTVDRFADVLAAQKALAEAIDIYKRETNEARAAE